MLLGVGHGFCLSRGNCPRALWNRSRTVLSWELIREMQETWAGPIPTNVGHLAIPRDPTAGDIRYASSQMRNTPRHSLRTGVGAARAVQPAGSGAQAGKGRGKSPATPSEAGWESSSAASSTEVDSEDGPEDEHAASSGSLARIPPGGGEEPRRQLDPPRSRARAASKSAGGYRSIG